MENRDNSLFSKQTEVINREREKVVWPKVLFPKKS